MVTEAVVMRVSLTARAELSFVSFTKAEIASRACLLARLMVPCTSFTCTASSEPAAAMAKSSATSKCISEPGGRSSQASADA